MKTEPDTMLQLNCRSGHLVVKLSPYKVLPRKEESWGLPVAWMGAPIVSFEVGTWE